MNAVVNPIIKEDMDYIVERFVGIGELSNSRILITGASGFIASYIVEALLALNAAKDYEISVFGLARDEQKFWNKFHNHKNDNTLKFLHHDVSDDLSHLNVHEFTHIIHSASPASPKYYGKNPVGTIEANTSGTSQLLKLAAACRVKSFLFFSSAEVYGQANQIPTNEQDYGFLDPLAVRSCYAESKRMGETLCVAWAHQFGVPAKIVRPFHTYGPGMELNDGRVYADFVKNIVFKEPILINGTGEAARAFCYLTDAVLGIFHVLIKGENACAYNLGNPSEEIKIKDLAHILQSLYPERSDHVSFMDDGKTGKYMTSAVDRATPDIRKIQSLGWNPHVDVKKGFQRTVQSYLYDA